MLGLRRGKVKLLPYSPKWANLFGKEKQLLKKTFGKTIIGIEHVGSTAIPGMPAKPIIDINVGVKSMKIARETKNQFKKIGYEHRPVAPGRTKIDLKGQELYVKGPEARRTYYVHVTVYNSNYWKKYVFFRDHLRQNLAAAKQYAELKKKLAKKYPNDRYTYTEKKEVFINKILKKAKGK